MEHYRRLCRRTIQQLCACPVASFRVGFAVVSDRRRDTWGSTGVRPLPRRRLLAPLRQESRLLTRARQRQPAKRADRCSVEHSEHAPPRCCKGSNRQAARATASSARRGTNQPITRIPRASGWQRGIAGSSWQWQQFAAVHALQQFWHDEHVMPAVELHLSDRPATFRS